MSGVVFDENGNPTAHCFQLGGGIGGEHDVVPMPRQREHAPEPIAANGAQTSAALPAQRMATASSPTRPAVGMTTKQLISQLRARLRVVESEIRTRRELEREREQIKRLISAATNERDNLRRISVAG